MRSRQVLALIYEAGRGNVSRRLPSQSGRSRASYDSVRVWDRVTKPAVRRYPEGDEMQIPSAVIAFQSARHKQQESTPFPNPGKCRAPSGGWPGR